MRPYPSAHDCKTSVPSLKGRRGLRSLAEWPSLPAHRDLIRLSMESPKFDIICSFYFSTGPRTIHLVALFKFSTFLTIQNLLGHDSTAITILDAPTTQRLSSAQGRYPSHSGSRPVLPSNLRK